MSFVFFVDNGVTYRPQSAKTSHRPTSAKDPMQVVPKNGKKTAKAFFYTDHRNGVGKWTYLYFITHKRIILWIPIVM